MTKSTRRAKKRVEKNKTPKMTINYSHVLQKKVFALLVLWFAVVGSGLSVVGSTHQTRKSVQALELERQKTERLKIEAGQLLLERSSLSAYSRVEATAVTHLKMQVPTIADIITIKSEIYK